MVEDVGDWAIIHWSLLLFVAEHRSRSSNALPACNTS
jgi:hypothetical protein